MAWTIDTRLHGNMLQGLDGYKVRDVTLNYMHDEIATRQFLSTTD